MEELRQRLAEAQRRLAAAEQAAEKMHAADARALAAELEARKQVRWMQPSWVQSTVSAVPSRASCCLPFGAGFTHHIASLPFPCS